MGSTSTTMLVSRKPTSHRPTGEDGTRGQLILALFTVVVSSAALRFYQLDKPETVCWDETHFGKMANYYINRTFFLDVHPPLGKMLIGLSGILTGYDGTFPFEKPGDNYNSTRYFGMRAFCALLGSCTAPLSYLTVLKLTNSIQAGLLAAIIVICDTGCLTLSRYILLDPILLFFIMLSTLCLVMFRATSHRSFHLSWWLWMAATGVSLACAFSVKFVGLFVILLAGLVTVQDLWSLLGNLSLPKTMLLLHLLSRMACLIFLPMLVYVVLFAVHLGVLNNSGTGDAHFSSHFQSSLKGNSLHNISMPKYVAYGSVVTLRSKDGLLHSHGHLYPEGFGPTQQQITMYHHKDVNNLWLIKRADVELDPAHPVQFVTHGDFVRLEHILTTRNLHSHAEPAPLTKEHFQVSGYGINGTGDMNDIWKVEIVNRKAGVRIQTVLSKIKFIHYSTGCVLYTTGKQLPKWGYEQQEVTCYMDGRISRHSMWNVEDHTNPRLPNNSFQVPAPSFLEKFIESHVIMLQENGNFKPKEGEVTSLPWQWPVNYKGQLFCKNERYTIYLLGNPVLFMVNLASLVIFVVLYGLWAVMLKRGYKFAPEIQERCKKTFNVCWFLFAGWLLHYLPFFAMGRVLYFHHYFPAVLFNSMLTGVLLDFVLKTVGLISSKARAGCYNSSLVVVVSGIIHSFYLFHPLSYGITPASANSTSNMAGLQWMESWEF